MANTRRQRYVVCVLNPTMHTDPLRRGQKHSRTASEPIYEPFDPSNPDQWDPARAGLVHHSPPPVVRPPVRLVPVPLSVVNSVPFVWLPETCLRPQPLLANSQPRLSLAAFGGYPRQPQANPRPPVQHPQVQYTLRPASWGHPAPVAPPNGRTAAHPNPQQIVPQYVPDIAQQRIMHRQRTLTHAQVHRPMYHPPPKGPTPPSLELKSSQQSRATRSPSIVSISSSSDEEVKVVAPPKHNAASEVPIAWSKKDLMTRVLDGGVRIMPSNHHQIRDSSPQYTTPAPPDPRGIHLPRLRLPSVQHREPNKAFDFGTMLSDAADTKNDGIPGQYSPHPVNPTTQQQPQSTLGLTGIVSKANPTLSSPTSSVPPGPLRQSPVDMYTSDLEPCQTETNPLRWATPIIVDETDERIGSARNEGTGSEAVPNPSNTEPTSALPPGLPIIAVHGQLADDICPFPGCEHRIGTTKSSCTTHLKNFHFPTRASSSNYQGSPREPLRLYDLKERVPCPWNKDGESCGKVMQLEQLGRHLSTTHICGMLYQCPHCFGLKDQTRRDAARRHIRAVHKCEPTLPDDVRSVLDATCIY